jgi:hypothetical protein
MSGSMSGMWKRSNGERIGRCHAGGDDRRPRPRPPRHISTLPAAGAPVFHLLVRNLPFAWANFTMLTDLEVDAGIASAASL